jgi:hypothetical protein
MSDSFVSDDHATLGHNQFDIAQTGAKHVIKLHSMADDLGGELVTGVGNGCWRHPASLARLAITHQLC